MYVSVKFYLYEILIHSVIHLLINLLLYQITISYPSGKRTQLVRNKLHQALCKAICKSENVEQTVISLLVKEKPREVVDAAAKVVSEEARELCKRNSNSILMKKDQESLMSFTWDKFNKELEIRAPNVLRIVSSIVSDIPPEIHEHSPHCCIWSSWPQHGDVRTSLHHCFCPCSWRMYTEGIHVLCTDNLLKELNVFEFDH